MTKYRVTLKNIIEFGTTVEAEDADAAVEAAYEMVPYEICGQCSGWNRDYWMEMGGEWSEYDDPSSTVEEVTE